MLQPNYQPLTEEQMNVAKDERIVYPRVMRTKIDKTVPPNQVVSVVSLMMHKQPKVIDGKEVYGMIKSRGTFPCEQHAREHAAKIVRDEDSLSTNFILPVGHWFKLCDDTSVCKNVEEVRLDIPKEQDDALREKRRENQRKMQEVRSRMQELQEDGDIYDDKTSLKYYSMRRVTEDKLLEQLEQYEINKRKLEETLREVQNELYNIETNHGEYRTRWIDCYNEERSKAGIPNFSLLSSHRRAHIQAMVEIAKSKDEYKSQSKK